MESNSRPATDMDDQAQYIDLKEISIDFIETRPTSDLELVFKDGAGVKYKSNKFKNGVHILWKSNIHVRARTSATLTIQRTRFKIMAADISVKFKLDKFGDNNVVYLEDSNRRVTVTVVYGDPKPLAGVTRVLGFWPTFSNAVIQKHRRRIPEVQFRVLIIGRANAGKTSILQRICETTESPVIYRGREEVRLDPSMDRGEHRIDDELVFSNHKGYVFHDSRGIESGSGEELMVLQKFIRRKCGERRLQDRLHAIWYCIPMDNQRPQLDLKFFKDICPDRNVPVIAVFTKYDQFRRNVRIHVEDFGSPDDNVSDVAEKRFEEHYLHLLSGDVKFVRLEQMHRKHMGCDKLIETTAAALNDESIALMLLVLQRGNLELSVKSALQRTRYHRGMGFEEIVQACLVPFPYIWWEKFSEESLSEGLEWEFSSRSSFLEEEFFDRFRRQIISLPTVQNLTATVDYHLILAVILILKHATFLRLSNMSPELALTHAEVDYQEENIDLKIQQHLAASSEEHSDESLAAFIMATDLSQSSIETTFV